MYKSANKNAKPPSMQKAQQLLPLTQLLSNIVPRSNPKNFLTVKLIKSRALQGFFLTSCSQGI